MDDLIARLEAEIEGSRELDAEIAGTVLPGEIKWKQHRFTGDSSPIRRYPTTASLSGFASEPVERYTTSLDAAMALAPEDATATVVRYPDGTGQATMAALDDTFTDATASEGATPALALTASALKARNIHAKQK